MGAEELGRQLRRARHHLGMSLADVHAVTAIPLGCLAALEEGRLDQLPSPVYARGYVRSYAEAVRLDGDDLALELWRLLEEARLAAAREQRPTRAGRPASARPRTTRPRTAVGAPPPSPLAALRQPESPWVPRPGRIRRLVPAFERTAIVVLLVVLAVALWALGRSGNGHHAPRVAAFESVRPGVVPRAPATTAPPGPASPAVLTPASDTGTQAVYAVGKDQFNVVVKATDSPCWVDIRSAPGAPSLFQGTLQPNEAHPVDAPGRLWIRVGDVGHAAVTVDGVPLTLPDKPAFPYNLLLQK